jgi:ABC-type transporter Mla subunit MlaD
VALAKAEEQAALLRSQRDALQAEFAKAGQQLGALRKSEAELTAQLAGSEATSHELTALRQALGLAERAAEAAVEEGEGHATQLREALAQKVAAEEKLRRAQVRGETQIRAPLPNQRLD